ncbi:hypothetical protein H4Q26_016991 [Puccinia striiformis f. sp. tritici PST-130]|uniref:Uncharacterized protein n=1 Tax=Puccinia striiformis f. sp. tritici PST-78 TaxID=1165861 RepID=A0A0L0VIG6_9BASI|nr:hypothetical protein H4Q26_016991 [Puccinia striiformis f. sp. tritici PST-130]KNE98789.1 hypothetical protein PSTG_07976 [Puccinia striiformis f. sp. tritici PST-78]
MSQEIVIFKQNLASKICRNVIEDLKDPTIVADEENIDITKFVSLIRLATKVNVVLITAIFFPESSNLVTRSSIETIPNAHLSGFL